nr:hypothetical protein BaRGS_017547 [Batillaria attramentaria]
MRSIPALRSLPSIVFDSLPSIVFDTVAVASVGRIFNIRWPEKIRNEELWERAGQEPVAKQILRRKWGWTGHTSIQHHTPSPDMEPAGEKEERPASQQLEAGH